MYGQPWYCWSMRSSPAGFPSLHSPSRQQPGCSGRLARARPQACSLGDPPFSHLSPPSVHSPPLLHPTGQVAGPLPPPRGASFCAPVKLRHFRFPSLLINMAMLFFTLFLLFCETGWLCFPMSYRNSTQIWLIWGSSLLIVTDTSVPSEGSETQSLWDHSDQNLTLHQVLAPD